MRVVLQRVSSASVTVDGQIISSIDNGLLILLGVEHADDKEDADWLIRKIVNMRIFQDDADKMNLSIQDVDGNILVVSQFTLHASTKKGNRPSFIKAAPPQQAEELYNYFVSTISSEMNKEVGTGSFGAMMEVALVNDGPVTITMDTKNKD